MEDFVSTPSVAPAGARPATAGRSRARPGIAIAVIAGAQLMVALDVTIAGLALLVALAVIRVRAGEINPAHVH